MGIEIADRNNPSRQMKVREDGTVDTNLTNNGSIVSSANPLPVSAYDSDGLEVNRSFDEDNYLSKFLLNGGSEDMSVDGSSTSKEFSYTVPAGKRVSLTRGFITIEDGNTEFVPGNFGAIAGVLTNGVVVGITPNGGSEVILETWTTNREIRNTMFDFDHEFKTAGAYIGRWTFAKDFQNGGFLLAVGDKISLTINDNLTGLDFFSFRIKGVIEDV